MDLSVYIKNWTIQKNPGKNEQTEPRANNLVFPREPYSVRSGNIV